MIKETEEEDDKRWVVRIESKYKVTEKLGVNDKLKNTQ